MIKAEIVADSIGPSNVRLTTFVLTYPRFIHAEFMTHRVFSRNASSSRAIPVSKQIQAVVDNPAIPLAFTKNQKGMQGGEALDGKAHEQAQAAWLQARAYAVEFAKQLAALDVHKQYANRILEPWAHITVVCTATDWQNFFALRCHPAAQPEIHALADEMFDLYQHNNPYHLNEGDWHVPFVDRGFWSKDRSAMALPEAVTRSVARCARVSYNNHDGTETTLEQDDQLYQRLLGSQPIHASPAEHQACATREPDLRSGNFRGWVQYRKTLIGECAKEPR